MSLKETYKSACEAYIKAFEKKQGYEFTDWIGDFHIAVFIEQYFLTLDEIRYDIDNNCPKGLIFQYQDDCVEVGFKNMHDKRFTKINYPSYAKGLRFEMLAEK